MMRPFPVRRHTPGTAAEAAAILAEHPLPADNPQGYVSTSGAPGEATLGDLPKWVIGHPDLGRLTDDDGNSVTEL